MTPGRLTGFVKQLLDKLGVTTGGVYTAGVAGPGSSTDNAVARFDGAGGATLQNSAVTVNDSGHVAPVTTNAQDLGTTASLWRTLYLTTSVLMGTARDLGLQYTQTAVLGINNGTANSAGDLIIKAVRFVENSFLGTITVYVHGGLGVNLGSARSVNWVDTDSATSGTPDIGLARSAAGVLKLTNGSTGYGRLRLAAAVDLISGAGTPEGAVTAGVGSLFLRTDGGAGTTLYVKESGTGNTGWVAK